MDPITSLVNSFSPDLGEFHSVCMNASNQNSQYPVVTWSSVSSQGQMEYNPTSYSQACSQQYVPSNPLNFQTTFPERHMPGTFIAQSQPQHHSESFYPYQPQTPPYFPQKHHQPSPHQFLHSPKSPCLNQSTSVNMYQTNSSQFAACSQLGPISPRHSSHQPSPHAQLLCSPKNNQPARLLNPQHQQTVLKNGNTQQQRSEQSPQLVVANQTSSIKDLVGDQFYSNQYSQIDKSFNSFSSIMQPTSPAHLKHALRTGTTANSCIGDSWSNSLIGGKLVSSGNTCNINQTKPTMPQVSNNSSLYNGHNQHPMYNNPTSQHLVPSVHPKAPPSYNSSCGDIRPTQNLQYKAISSYAAGKEVKNVGNQSKINGKSVRPVVNDSLYTENHKADLFHPQRPHNTNANRNSKTKDATLKGSNTVNNGPGKVVQKSVPGNVKSNMYKPSGPIGPTSFQSDIEAMQADVASYSSHRVSSQSNKIAPVSQETSAKRSTESNGSIRNELNQMSNSFLTHNHAHSAGIDGLSRDSSKPGSQNTKKISREEALAAILIKQEMVDNLNKYKIVSSTTSSSTKTVSATQSTSQANKLVDTSVTISNKATNDPIKNRLSTVKDVGVDIDQNQQLNNSARRHSLAELKSKSFELMHCSDPLSNKHIAATNKTSSLTSKTTPPNLNTGNSNGVPQAAIQNRRHTASYLPDKASTNKQQISSSQVQRNRTGSQKSLAQIETRGHPEFPSQSIISHLFDQVQNMEKQYSYNQQQNLAPGSNVMQRCIDPANINWQMSTGSNEKSSLAVSESTHEKHITGQAVGNYSNKITNQSGVHPAVPLPNRNLSNNSDPANSRTFSSLVPCKNISADNQTHRKIKTESACERSDPPTVCYVMLHKHKLICLKSDSDKLIILCQLHRDCFPNKTLESICTCMDSVLRINIKVLNHQDKEKIVLFLKRNGYHKEGVVQTINLEDAVRVYHYLNTITQCNDSYCVVEMLNDQVDFDKISSVVNPSMREIKKEKACADENSFGKPISSSDSGVSSTSNIKEQSQRIIKRTKENNTFANSLHTPASSLPIKGSGNPTSGSTLVDNDESDDIIIVEAPEDPNILRWAGTGPKTGGLCNTIVGQLRSYVHGNERYLVVDDLCKVFGSSDFYDGVERENIILHSCCPEIASFINAISTNFPPIKSTHDILVKQSDIGIHISDTNSSPVTETNEKTNVGISHLKRPLCKMEIIDDDDDDDDDYISPKQFRFNDFALASNSESQESIEKHKTDQSEAVKFKSSLDAKLIGINNQDNDKEKEEIEGNMISGQLGQNNNSQTIAKCTLETTAHGSITNMHLDTDEVSLNTGGKNRTQFIDSPSNNQTVENSNNNRNLACDSNTSISTVDSVNGGCLNSNKTEQDMHPCVQEPLVNCDISRQTGISCNVMSVKDVEKFPFTQPLSPESSRSTASYGAPSPFLIDLNNPLKTQPSEVDKIEQNSLTIIRPHLVSSNGQLAGSLSDISDSLSVQSQKHCTQNTLDDEIIEGNHLKTTECNQTDNLEIVVFTNDNVDNCLENLILLQSNKHENNTVSGTQSSVLKSRMEKLKKVLEDRRNNDLPLPKFVLDNCPDLNILLYSDNNTNDAIENEKVEISAQKENSGNYITVNIGSSAPTELIGASNSSSLSNVIQTGDLDTNSSNSDLCHHNGHLVTPESNSQVILFDQLATSNQEGISGSQESSLHKNKDCTSILSLARYFPSNHGSLDDSDVMFGRNTVTDVRRAFEKLWHEHRELLGTVDELKKLLAQEREEREKCEKISKYFEGIIHDMTSTFQNGDGVDADAIK